MLKNLIQGSTTHKLAISHSHNSHLKILKDT